jgi:ketosteroid isomerase-like protein
MALVVLAAVLGCPASESPTMTAADAQRVQDTVMVLENAANVAVDALDCNGAFAYIGDRAPLFVFNAEVASTRAIFRESCDGMVAPRAGAVWAVDARTAHALSPSAAYVVRDGVYTINLKDGTTERMRLVATSVWAHQQDGWKMVHLHESGRPIVP